MLEQLQRWELSAIVESAFANVGDAEAIAAATKIPLEKVKGTLQDLEGWWRFFQVVLRQSDEKRVSVMRTLLIAASRSDVPFPSSLKERESYPSLLDKVTPQEWEIIEGWHAGGMPSDREMVRTLGIPHYKVNAVLAQLNWEWEKHLESPKTEAQI